jgi:hypothetical protein
MADASPKRKSIAHTPTRPIFGTMTQSPGLLVFAPL